MRKITLEEHYIQPEFSQYIKDQIIQSSFPTAIGANLPAIIMEKLAEVDARRLAEMDAHGIDVQVLSYNSPGVQLESDPARAVRIAQQMNDYLAERVRAHPDRFAGFATLPLQDPQAAADELERTVTQLGFKGAMVHGHTNGAYLDERRFWVVWERAVTLDVPIYLHPVNSLPDQVKSYEGYPGLLGATWNWTLETATHALRIICGGVFDAFPQATLILGHMGETLPFGLRRIDDGWKRSPQSQTLKELPSHYVKHNVLITTSGNCSLEALICSLLAVGADHILFSVDYPYVPMDFVVQFIETAPLSDPDRAKIFHLNAERVLKLG